MSADRKIFGMFENFELRKKVLRAIGGIGILAVLSNPRDVAQANTSLDDRALAALNNRDTITSTQSAVGAGKDEIKVAALGGGPYESSVDHISPPKVVGIYTVERNVNLRDAPASKKIIGSLVPGKEYRVNLSSPPIAKGNFDWVEVLDKDGNLWGYAAKQFMTPIGTEQQATEGLPSDTVIIYSMTPTAEQREKSIINPNTIKPLDPSVIATIPEALATNKPYTINIYLVGVFKVETFIEGHGWIKTPTGMMYVVFKIPNIGSQMDDIDGKGVTTSKKVFEDLGTRLNRVYQIKFVTVSQSTASLNALNDFLSDIREGQYTKQKFSEMFQTGSGYIESIKST